MEVKRNLLNGGESRTRVEASDRFNPELEATFFRVPWRIHQVLV